jgi:hypothetical protein
LSGYPNLSCSLPCWFTGASLQRHSDSVHVLWRMHRWRPGTFPLQHQTIIIKLVIKFITRFEWRHPSRLKMGVKPPSCDHSISCFSKEQCCFYVLFYSLPLSAILSRNSPKLVRLGRARTNLHNVL